ncbi:MAG: alpha/beta hydrolase [Woeseiaceae bacterium]|nr:alpha/beta hydrolase [Woeseiaceae bacterium]
MSITDDVEHWIGAAEYLEHDGRRFAYWSAGQGRPLLLVHGYPTSSWDWCRVWDALATSHRLVACDMLGFGLSDKPPSGYSIRGQTDLQQALLDRLGIHDFDAVVHDYGVSVGQEMLARKNSGSGFAGLGRIAFLNGGLFPEQHRMVPIQKLGISPFGFLVGLLMNRQRFGAAFSEVFGPETQPTAQELDEHWRFISHNNGHRLMHKLLHYIADRREHRERWVGALQNSRVPIKLICGGADPVSGRHMFDHFRELVPGAEAVCLDDIGHYPQLEAPSRVLAEVVPFLE